MQQNQLHNLNLLLMQVALGDENAFREIHDFYGSQLNDYIMGLTRSRFLTEEVAQDVFLKIWLNRKNLLEINCFTSYLFVIARNHTFDCLKQINRKKKREKKWMSVVVNTLQNDTTETPMERSNEIIDAAVKMLPPRQKKIYFLRREGAKPQKIAEELSISVGTVKKHQELAIRFLRNQIRADTGGNFKI